MKVEIRDIDEARASLATLARSGDHLIYAYPEFIDFLISATEARARVIIAEIDGRPIGALPILERSQPGEGRIVNSLPWYGSHGGCTIDPSAADAGEVRRAILSVYRNLIDEPDLISATLVLSHAEEAFRDEYVDALSPTIVENRNGQITSFPASVGSDGRALFDVFKQKTRNLVRKGLKQGFEERVSDDSDAWSALHRIHSENMAAIGGAAKPKRHFDALRANLQPQQRRLSLAMDGETVAAALLLLYGGRTVEYLTPAIDVRERPRQPLSFLIWRGMTDAISRGYAEWNWGGTWKTQERLHHFKAGFGAEDAPYSYLVVAPPSGVAFMKSNRNRLQSLFPYFYVYPYAALDDPS